MPLYEYKCEKCGKVFEVMQKFSDAPLTTHEECGGHVDRLLSAPALQFKGSGWYITDYAKSGSSSNGSSKSDSSSKSSDSKSSSSTTSSDSSSSTPPASSSTSSDKKG
jgi:putative FmdB family regulatory protein